MGSPDLTIMVTAGLLLLAQCTAVSYGCAVRGDLGWVLCPGLLWILARSIEPRCGCQKAVSGDIRGWARVCQALRTLTYGKAIGKGTSFLPSRWYRCIASSIVRGLMLSSCPGTSDWC